MIWSDLDYSSFEGNVFLSHEVNYCQAEPLELLQRGRKNVYCYPKKRRPPVSQAQTVL